ncbi:MAG: AraC family transcriptional regulator, partial [Victivallaceae bacterium]|nr:AraC family transcriptional regulator [Victivallaceae bacterium]
AVPEQIAILSLSEIISYIESNYQHAITVSALAKRASMSEVTFYRLFKKAFNMSPVNYLIAVRIARAQEMLENSRLSVSEIASRTGFTDSNYFSRAFKKLSGASPRLYRSRRTTL